MILKIGLLLILVAAGNIHCFGQVYSQSIYAGGVYDSDWWSVGSPSFKFGLGQTSYEIDPNGFIIFAMFAPVNRKPQPGDTWHYQTRFFLGPMEFNTALPPAKAAILGIAISILTSMGVYVLFTRLWKARRTSVHKALI